MSYPVLEKISELLMKLSTKKRELLGLAIILALLKVYCRGTKCKAYRELFGKVAVVTGGNTGIGKATV